MKKILVVVFAVVIGFAVSANAQDVPNVGIYFDAGGGEMQKDCLGTGVFDNAYVIAVNWNMWMNGIEYGIWYPAQVTFFADTPAPGYLKAGSSPLAVDPLGPHGTSGGIGITMPLPANSWDPLLVQTIVFTWECDDCSVTNIPWVVDGHSFSGEVRAIRWPDLTEFYGVGLTSYICATVPVEETTWGGIKSLYQ
jgi:hypothetical protein